MDYIRNNLPNYLEDHIVGQEENGIHPVIWFESSFLDDNGIFFNVKISWIYLKLLSSTRKRVQVSIRINDDLIFREIFSDEETNLRMEDFYSFFY